MKFGVLGFGKMGGAIVKGTLKGLFKAEDIYVYDSFVGAIDRAKELGLNACKTRQQVVDNADIVLIAIKPQDLKDALIGIDNKDKVFISIVAGVTLNALTKLLNKTQIARVMPNTCAEIGKAVSLLTFGDGFDDKNKKIVVDILSTIGVVEEIDEKFMDDLIPLSGSFTAYTYAYLKAFSTSCSERGVDFDKALRIVSLTMQGSTQMVIDNKKDIDTLIKDVCSKGGTTLAGLDKLLTDGFYDSIKSCVDACANRSKELGKNFEDSL